MVVVVVGCLLLAFFSSTFKLVSRILKHFMSTKTSLRSLASPIVVGEGIPLDWALSFGVCVCCDVSHSFYKCILVWV